MRPLGAARALVSLDVFEAEHSQLGQQLQDLQMVQVQIPYLERRRPLIVASSRQLLHGCAQSVEARGDTRYPDSALGY
jgi:hypothetical protein